MKNRNNRSVENYPNENEQMSAADEIIGGCVPTMDELNVDDIVNLMFAYEEGTLQSQQSLASKLKLRANEFISQIDTSQKYIDLIQSIIFDCSLKVKIATKVLLLIIKIFSLKLI